MLIPGFGERQDEPASSGTGGLSDSPMGGIAKFLGNVARGADMVLSHPLYARLWSGVVSGQAQNPVAGPAALSDMQDAALQRRMAQMPSASDTLNQLRLADYQDRQRRMDALRGALASNDRTAIERAASQAFPEQAASRMLAPPTDPKLQAVMTPQGPRYVRASEAVGMEPYRAPLVQNTIGGPSGLNPYQTEQTAGQLRDDYERESKPYNELVSRISELQALLSNIQEEPTSFQSEAAATAFTKGLKPTEAVMRDDIARVLGQGWMNIAKGFMNLPQKASRAQIEDMLSALIQLHQVAAMRQQFLEDKYQSLGSRHGISIPSYLQQYDSSGGGIPGGTDGLPEIE